MNPMYETVKKYAEEILASMNRDNTISDSSYMRISALLMVDEQSAVATILDIMMSNNGLWTD